MKRVAISTLGCKTNQFESAAMVEQLSAAGYRVVPFTEQSDIYIVNSCTVTARTDAETRRLIRRARRLNPEARVVATGCYAQVAPGELECLPEVDSVVGNREKQDIIALVESGGSRPAETGKLRRAYPRLSAGPERLQLLLLLLHRPLCPRPQPQRPARRHAGRHPATCSKRIPGDRADRHSSGCLWA